MADTLTATIDQAHAEVDIRLSWTSTPVPRTATIERVNVDDGTVMSVRNADPATLVAGEWVGTDYEAPLDQSFYYRATSPDRPGVILTSPTYTMASGGTSWFKHPGKPSLNMPVIVHKPPDWGRPVKSGLFDILGRTRPIAVTMRRNSERGDLIVVTRTENERLNMLALLEDGIPLFWSTPAGYGVGNVYISIGDVTEVRPSGLGYESARKFTLPITVVDRPSGSVLATGNTWANVLSAYATWRDFLDTEQQWAGPLDGIGN